MNTHKRATALFVALAFIVLLQVSAMPLRADQAPDRGGVAVSSPEQGPSYVEEEGTTSTAAKKSIVPIILIGVGVAALAAVLVLVVFKTNYDIVGSWHIILTGTEGGAPNKDYDPVVFTGDKKSGTYQVETFYDGMGTYTVDGKKVTLRSTHASYPNWVWNGEFTDKDHISGTSTFSSYSWTWTASRNAGTAAAPPAKHESQSMKPVLE